MATKKAAPKKATAKKTAPKKATSKKTAASKPVAEPTAKQMVAAFDLLADWGAIICTPVDVIDVAEDHRLDITADQAAGVLDVINDDVQKYVDKLLIKQFKKMKLPKIKPAK